MPLLSPLFLATRPIRRLLTIGISASVLSVYLKAIFHQPPELQALIGLGLLIPMLHASVLTEGLHELMHRNHFPLLPNAGARVRRLFCIEGALLAIASLTGARLLAPGLPLGALAGVLLISYCIPLLNTRRRLLYHGTINPWYPLVFCIVAVIALKYPEPFRQLVCLAPLATLLIGALCAGFILHRSFTRKSLIARLQTPFISLQSLMHFNPDKARIFTQHLRSEILKSNEITLPLKHYKLRLRGERFSLNWWHDLMAAVHFPRNRLFGTSPRSLLFISLKFFGYVAVVLGAACLLKFFSPEQIADTLVAYAKGANLREGKKMIQEALPIQMLIAMPFVIAMMSLPALRLRPRLPFPMARKTMAACILRNTLVNSAWATCMPLSVIGVIIACALFREEPLGFWVAQRMLTLSLLFAPLSLLLASTSLSQKPWLHSATPFLFMGLCISLITITATQGKTILLGGSTLAIVSAILTPAAFLLFRHLLHKRYLHGDLLGELKEQS